MAANSISYLVGGIFALVGIFGIALNTTVLFAIHKGRLLSSKASPVYILSSQTLADDTLMVLTHLIYQAPTVALQRDLIPTELDFIFEFILLYGWFHNSLSHILIALNRLVVIVFKRSDIFNRSRTIALVILHHIVAAALSIATEFMLPCCKLSFSWRAFSYAYDELAGVINYSAIITIPIETASSLISIVSYAVICYPIRGHGTRLFNGLDSFQYFAIGNTSDLYIYGVITMLVEINALANATVYLSNNKEIQNSVHAMLGNSSKVHSIQDKTQSIIGRETTK